MARIEVRPAKDGHDMRSNWMVHKNGKMVGRPHVKKSAAKRKMNRIAEEGDLKVVKGTDGQVLAGYPKRHRGSRETNEDQQESGQLPGMGTFKTGIVDGFNYD